MKTQIVSLVAIIFLTFLLSSSVSGKSFSWADEQGVEKTNSLSVFPNPVKGKIILKVVLVDHSNIEIELFDITGKSIYKKPKKFILEGKYQFIIDTAKFKDGIYLCRFSSGNQILTKRIIVRH